MTAPTTQNIVETDFSSEQSEEDKKIAERIVAHFETLFSDRSNHETLWHEGYKYTVPHKEDVVSSKTPGQKHGSQVYDTTAITSNIIFSGAMHGMLSNPSAKFFELYSGIFELDNKDNVRKYFQTVEDIILKTLNFSNYQTEIHEVYEDQGVIGTSAMFIGDDDDLDVYFSARPMKEIFIDEDHRGFVDTIYRSFEWNARQLVQEFGEKILPKLVLKMYRDGSRDKFQVIHAVFPGGEETLGKAMAKTHKFASVYVLAKGKYTIEKKGFREFPYIAPRWIKAPGEKYGRGPGTLMLPDIKMASAMMLTTLQAGQLGTLPPMLVTDDSVIGKVRLTPKGLTVVRASSMRGGQAPVQPLLTGAQVEFGYQVVNDVRARIRAGFFVDQLMLPQGPQKTAAEVNRQTEDMLRLMGPMLGRQQFENLAPTFRRVYGILKRKGRLPNPPSELDGRVINIRYSSLAARAQRMAEGQNLLRGLAVVNPLIEMDPQVRDLVEMDDAFKHVLDIYGWPRKLYRSEREVKAIREARAEANMKAAVLKEQQLRADVASKTLPGAAAMVGAQRE